MDEVHSEENLKSILEATGGFSETDDQLYVDTFQTKQ